MTLRRMVPLPEPREVQLEPEVDRGDPLTQAQTFQIHEPVWIRSFKGKNHPRWVPAITIRTVGGGCGGVRTRMETYGNVTFHRSDAEPCRGDGSQQPVATRGQ